jgi:hypothetical protein
MEKKSIKKPTKQIKGEMIGYRPRLVVKFHDYVDIPYQDGIEEYFQKLDVGPWDRMVAHYPGLTLRRMFTALDPEKVQKLVDTAVEMDPTYEPPNLLTYFIVDSPPGEDPEELVKAFEKWPSVQKAYYDPPGSEPQVNPNNDPRFGNQGYLDPAPDGIDAEFAWPRAGGVGFPGGDGAGLNVIDMERGWTLNHEDLNAQGATLLHGSIRNGSRAHGTSVLGEICSVDNTLGGVGIAPNVASVNVVSYWNSNRPDAILAAIDNLSFGDVLLLEAQVSHTVGTVTWDMMPIEVQDGVFDVVRLATALGIVVVAAAGNGANDLDTYVDAAGDAVFDRTAAGFRDSGAIIVGSASSTTPHTRRASSNHGNRIDCYAWGDSVDTCSSNSGGSTTMYTGTFNATSAASPIITGAALVVQGIAEADLGYRFSPLQIREILSDPANGTLSDDPPVDRIGVMPDLRTIIQNVLAVTPDIYIRDFVGDAGDPHTGSISASPDIILRQTQEPNPQAAFGEGSGTENSNNLGHVAEAGQDNFIYVRVRNRGGPPPVDVEATVYWAPPSSLVTPDQWTLIGSVTIPNVPVGDILTVSDEIVWPAAAVPATGHYCFIGLIGTADDPAPGLADFLDWDNYCRFIRENNNVTWRNFNVVDNQPDPADADPSDPVDLPFLAPGPPDKARRMSLEVVAKLPEGARVWLEVPKAFVDGMKERSPFNKIDKKRGHVRLPVNPHGRRVFGEALFPAKSRMKARLLVKIPKKFLRYEYEVYVRQVYQRQEVGRITWRLTPRKKRRPPTKRHAQMK